MTNTSNMCIFEGRIANDPKITQLNGATGPFKKATFNIAVDRNLTKDQRQKAKSDPSIKTCDFIPCSTIGSSAELIEKYYPKGKAIRVVGRYETYQYQDRQTGETKYGNVISIDNIGFVTQDSKNLTQAPAGGYNTPAQQPQTPSSYPMFDDAPAPAPEQQPQTNAPFPQGNNTEMFTGMANNELPF